MKNTDWRNMENGLLIPSEAGYSDQPSIVRAKDGSWVCTITTGQGSEGARGQYVNITRSTDQGKTWSEPISLEDPAWESAYSSLAVAPSGRIYCFYCYNLEHVDIRRVPLARYDMGGAYCYRYSEDCGKTWSKRYVAQVREFEIDRNQEDGCREFEGKPLRFFWNVSRVFFEGEDCYSPLIKYHYKHNDVLHSSEGVLLRCRNLDKDPEHAVWETLPDGEVGLRTPQGGGRVSEEQSYVILSDGTIFVVYRTIDGHPACTYSRDGGHTFEPPEYLTYADGRRVKHNRAANFIWPIGHGKYLYWYNNQGFKSYERRNPIWCGVAEEKEGPDGMRLAFSEPEILLYNESEQVIMSYPDLLWDDGWYVTETQKSEARIHPIDQGFIDTLVNKETHVEAPVWSWKSGEEKNPWPEIRFSERSFGVPGDNRKMIGKGCSVHLTLENAQPGETLLSTESPDGGLRILADADGCLTVWMGDMMAECTVSGSIPVCDGGKHHAALIVDSLANVVYMVVDGKMDDGGEKRICGWRWMNRAIISLPGSAEVVTGNAVQAAEFYDRALMTCEAASLMK